MTKEGSKLKKGGGTNKAISSAKDEGRFIPNNEMARTTIEDKDEGERRQAHSEKIRTEAR